MRFYTIEAVLALHQLNIERFGGSPGICDQGALESALNAPIDRAYYEEADEFKCAAAYGFNLCQAHAFVDGNKRVAAAACLGFLRLNGFDPKPTIDEVRDTFLKIASSEMNRDQLEEFLRERTALLGASRS